MKQFVYSIFAPFLRWLLKDSITGKLIGNSGLRLYYDRSQHLGFLFAQRIEYEREVSLKVLSLVREGDLVFEIGSNIGQYTLLLSEKVGPGGRVVCIEPDSDNFSFLSFNVLKNQLQNVTLLRNAVSDKLGIATFHKDTKTGGRMSSLLQSYTADHFEGKTEEVETLTLRYLIDEFGIPDFVKVDVEGAEGLVFSDPGSIVKSTTYLIEVQHETKDAIFNIFQDKGFRIEGIESSHQFSRPDEVPVFCNLLIRHHTHT